MSAVPHALIEGDVNWLRLVWHVPSGTTWPVYGCGRPGRDPVGWRHGRLGKSETAVVRLREGDNTRPYTRRLHACIRSITYTSVLCRLHYSRIYACTNIISVDVCRPTCAWADQGRGSGPPF